VRDRPSPGIARAAGRGGEVVAQRRQQCSREIGVPLVRRLAVDQVAVKRRGEPGDPAVAPADARDQSCLVKVISRTAGVVENLMTPIRGGISQPSSQRNAGWFPNGIMCCTTQKITASSADDLPHAVGQLFRRA
jgi:hypothetical protein